MVWQMITDMYGDLFTRSHGVQPDANKVWAATLAGLDRNQIQKGLNVLAESGREFPPSAPVFRAMCLQKSEEEIYQRIIQEEQERKKALNKPVNREAGRKYAAELKKALQSSSSYDQVIDHMEQKFDELFR